VGDVAYDIHAPYAITYQSQILTKPGNKIPPAEVRIYCLLTQILPASNWSIYGTPQHISSVQQIALPLKTKISDLAVLIISSWSCDKISNPHLKNSPLAEWPQEPLPSSTS
jgi:hypothetical protein